MSPSDLAVTSLHAYDAAAPFIHWPLRRFSDEAASAHSRLISHPLGAIHWSASQKPVHRSFWLVQVHVNGSPVRLHVKAPELDNWAAAVAGPQIPAAVASAGVAHAGAPLWQALSSSLHAPVQFVHARRMSELRVPDDAIAWQLHSSGWQGVLHAATPEAWEQLVAFLPKKTSVGGGEGLMEMPIALSFGFGRARLNASDMGRLKKHCVVVLDDRPALLTRHQRDLHELQVTVLAGSGRLPVTRAVWIDDRLHRVMDFLNAEPINVPRTESGGDVSQTEQQATAHNEAEARTTTPAPAIPAKAAKSATPTGPSTAPDLADLEVDVRFEIGRQRWSLRQLVQWRVGQPLPLNISLRDTPVTAWVQERCVASGRLVVVGERLGVRLDEVFAAAPALRPAERREVEPVAKKVSAVRPKAQAMAKAKVGAVPAKRKA